MNINNILDTITGVPEKSSCQEICQSEKSCDYFVYDDVSHRCFLVLDCATLVDCSSCWSGPDYPSVNSCLPPTLPPSTEQSTAITTSPSQPMAALLLSGQYTAETESWPCDLAIPSIPQKVYSGAAAVLGSKVFLCGGTIGSGCYVLEGKTWSTGPNMIKERSSLSLNSVGDTLIATGGSNSQTVEFYKDEEAHWQLAYWNLTSDRYNHCAVTLSNTELILAGGGTPNMAQVEKYNIETGEVVALPDLIHPTAGHACTLQGDSLVVSGGYDAAGYTINLVTKLSLTTLTWSNLPSLPVRRYGHNMALLNGALVVFGGNMNDNTYRQLAILNGTQWETQYLQKGHGDGAMVILPCP